MPLSTYTAPEQRQAQLSKAGLRIITREISISTSSLSELTMELWVRTAFRKRQLVSRKTVWLAVSILAAVTTPSAFLFGSELPIAACEVFTNPSRFDGKKITIEGVYVQYEHATFLLPYPQCETQEVGAAGIWASFGVRKAVAEAEGRKGTWYLCTMRGKWRASGNHLRFDVKSVANLRKVKPYDFPPRK